MWHGRLPRLAVGPRLYGSAGVRALKVAGERGYQSSTHLLIPGINNLLYRAACGVGWESRLLCGKAPAMVQINAPIAKQSQSGRKRRLTRIFIGEDRFVKGYCLAIIGTCITIVLISKRRG